MSDGNVDSNENSRYSDYSSIFGTAWDVLETTRNFPSWVGATAKVVTLGVDVYGEYRTKSSDGDVTYKDYGQGASSLVGGIVTGTLGGLALTGFGAPVAFIGAAAIGFIGGGVSEYGYNQYYDFMSRRSAKMAPITQTHISSDGSVTLNQTFSSTGQNGPMASGFIRSMFRNGEQMVENNGLTKLMIGKLSAIV